MPKKKAKKKPKTKKDRHSVKVTIDSPLQITKADIEFEVLRDGEVFGALFISRGAVAWKPRNGKKNYRFEWARFDQVMQWGTKTHGNRPRRLVAGLKEERDSGY